MDSIKGLGETIEASEFGAVISAAGTLVTRWRGMCSDDGGKSYASNAMRFSTKELCDRYLVGLSYRWLSMTDWHSEAVLEHPDTPLDD
jgi:hypothetical protein